MDSQATWITGMSDGDFAGVVAGAILYSLGLLLCIYPSAFHFKELKSFFVAKLHLPPRDWAGSILVYVIIGFGCLVWPLSIIAILVRRAVHKYLYTSDYTCCGFSFARQTPSPQQGEPRSDSYDLEAGHNSTASLPQNSPISVPPPEHAEAMEPVAKLDSTGEAVPPPPYQ